MVHNKDYVDWSACIQREGKKWKSKFRRGIGKKNQSENKHKLVQYSRTKFLIGSSNNDQIQGESNKFSCEFYRFEYEPLIYWEIW